jgi:hypothetical protein
LLRTEGLPCRRGSHALLLRTQTAIVRDSPPGRRSSHWVASAEMFDHVGIAVADLAASERFYRTVLSALGAEPTGFVVAGGFDRLVISTYAAVLLPTSVSSSGSISCRRRPVPPQAIARFSAS